MCTSREPICQATAVITVHCGVPKSGSSSIQLALKLAATADRRLMITPAVGDDHSIHGLAVRVRMLASHPEAILSDETLLVGSGESDFFSVRRMNVLRDELAGSPFRVVIYVRPQADWLPSVYTQQIQSGMDVSVNSFWTWAQDQRLFCWSALIHALEAETGAQSVVVRAYTGSRDVVADFFGLCGLGNPPSTGRAGFRENVSIAAAQTALLRSLNASPGLSVTDRQAFRALLQGGLADGAPRGFSPFPEEVQAAIVQRYRSDWREIGEAIEPIDHAEARVFAEVAARWTDPPSPFAGYGIEDPLVQQEAIRSLRVLALAHRPRPSTRLARLRSRVSDDPGSLVGVVKRKLAERRRSLGRTE